MTTTDRDTEPMTLGELELDTDWHDDWPTEKITRTGARRRTAYGSIIGWALLTILAGGALGGGAWFAATANAHTAPPTSPAVVGANPTGGSTQAGLIVIPTTGTTTRAVRTDARKAAAVAPQDTATTSTATSPAAPADTTGTSTAADTSTPTMSPTDTSTSSDATPTPTPPIVTPTPVSTATVPNDPGCVNITYSDGKVHLVCDVAPNPSTSS